MIYSYEKFKFFPLSTLREPGDLEPGDEARQTEKLKPISPRFTGDNYVKIMRFH